MAVRRPISAIAEVLRTETVGGSLLLLAVLAALVFANTPLSTAYDKLAHYEIGPHVGHLHLSLEEWAADGLLAIFFFVAGLELKREFVVGELRDPRRAAVPVVAAICGVAVPAIIYSAVVWHDPTLRIGWAIPAATDIAFALAVLAVVGRRLPGAVRTFLLTLAVVDDLIAILIIAVVYTDTVHWWPLLGGVLAVAAFALVIRIRWAPRWLMLSGALLLGCLAWAFVHASGIHATVAGVALALVVPVRARPGEEVSVEEWLDHRIRPISAGFAVPVFAFFASGVALSGAAQALHDPVAFGVLFGLVGGKAIGVFAGTWLVVKFTGAVLDPTIRWSDLAGVSLLSGIGFTVSLLIGELAFGSDSIHDDASKLAVLAASVIAALLGALVLGRWGSEAAEPG
ncbi:Na+/H+ antiporter NhaA [Jatrophihabitans sp. GAS493]|uniref:Na+/H+ antiporter NhaA n=1 Tax=Jatrophihabitans sp. GAS493 TaxID=1907575 RepID=UPI001A7E0565|nr:Na+/H+ antiporter NhaA [Jatrophihabitans sp. GAS493]